MIAGAVLCPAPPLLLPGATGGVVAEVEVIRQHCLDALRYLLSRVPDRLVLVGAGTGGTVPPLHRVAPGAVAESERGRPDDEPPGQPVSLGVGLGLLAQAGIDRNRVQLHPLGADLTAQECAAFGADLVGGPDQVGLVVMADGTARRRSGSPGSLDARAIPFDQHVQNALLATDVDALLAIDPGLAGELWVAGRVGWQVLAGALTGFPASAGLRYSGDPFGVWYAVIDWTIG